MNIGVAVIGDALLNVCIWKKCPFKSLPEGIPWVVASDK